MTGRLQPAALPPVAVPVVAVERVGVTYGEGPSAQRALDEVSLAVLPGALLLLTGPSGSGKTTLLQVLGCLRRPTAGRVLIDGAPLEADDEAALGRLRLARFGFVFQAYNLFPTLRAWENVAVALDLKGVRGAAAVARSRALLDRVGLAARADAFPAELSGGQKQRVAIARALAADPAVILADEPTAALDGATGAQIAGLLRALADHGRAVVIVTHDHRLRPYADRIVTIEDGRLRDGDDPADRADLDIPSPARTAAPAHQEIPS